MAGLNTTSPRQPMQPVSCRYCGNDKTPFFSDTVVSDTPLFWACMCLVAEPKPRLLPYIKRQRHVERPKDIVEGICSGCKCDFQHTKGKLASFCPECKDMRKVLSRVRYEQSDKGKAAYARLLAKRKERMQGGEKIKKLNIFKRDGWHCRICGVHTPPMHMRTSFPTAPELDHIVSLARGGKHVASNVQLACAKCNRMKGDRPQEDLKARIKRVELLSEKGCK